MAAPHLQTIRMQLRDQLLTVTSVLEDVPVVAENRALDETADLQMWIAEQFFPAAEATVASRMTEASGVVQYDICVRKGTGTEEAEALAQEIANAFTPRALNSRGVGMHVDRVERYQGRMLDEKWVRFPVTITWRTFKDYAFL